MKAAWSATLALLVVCVLVINWEQYRTLEQIAHGIGAHMQQSNQLIHTYVSGGLVKTVTTTREEGETKEHWERRHLDDIAAAWQGAPPDG